MKLPWQNKDEQVHNSGGAGANTGAGTNTNTSTKGNAVPLTSSDNATNATETEKLPKGYTPKKGRPTPKRDEVERAKGIRRDHNPSSPKSSSQRKALKESMTKEEWKAYREKEKREAAEQRRRVQAAMDRGDEQYLLARDQGEVRRFVRDWVDERRFVNNLVMPVALALLVIMFIGQKYPEVAGTLSMGAMAIMIVFFFEGLWIGRQANKAVAERFPNTDDTGIGLGFYAYSRSTQPRKLRQPKPRVAIKKR